MLNRPFCCKDKLFARIGFTLAEILVTLTIIGVVAALTIPALITSVQSAQYIAAWKKSFSSLSQATLKMKDDNGGSLINLYTNNGVAWDTQIGLPRIYAKYLKVVTKCDSYWGPTVGKCWHQSLAWYNLAGTPQSNNNVFNIGMGLILADGSLIATCPYNENCTNTATTTQGACGLMMIDVNGFKGPNTIGKDIYGANITKDGLFPWGSDGSWGHGSTNGWANGALNLIK